MIVRLAVTPGTETPLMPTWLPASENGSDPTPTTVMRSQLLAPGGTARVCGLLVWRTLSDTVPDDVCTVTLVTGAPMKMLSSNPTRITPGSTGWSKSTCSH